MKKLLLGTTALAAIGLTAGDALAQGYARLGGFVRNWAMIADHDSATLANGSDPRSVWFTSNNEVFVLGETKLDNGLAFGFRVEFEGWSNTSSSSLAANDDIDEVWVYVKGAFGEFRMGEEDDARKMKAYSVYIGGLLGTDSPDGVYSLGTSSSYHNLDNDSPKILYFSPSFGGFSFAASYMPDGTKGTRSFALQGEADCDGTQSRNCTGNAWSVSADYRGKFGDATIGADIGYSRGENELGLSDPSAFRADIFARISEFEIGTWYGKGKNTTSAALGFGSQAFGIGGLYTMGPWQFGAIWQRGKTDIVGGTNKINHYVLGAAYKLGGGVQALASYNYQEREIGAADFSASTVVLGLAASF